MGPSAFPGHSCEGMHHTILVPVLARRPEFDSPFTLILATGKVRYVIKGGLCSAGDCRHVSCPPLLALAQSLDDLTEPMP